MWIMGFSSDQAIGLFLKLGWAFNNGSHFRSWASEVNCLCVLVATYWCGVQVEGEVVVWLCDFRVCGSHWSRSLEGLGTEGRLGLEGLLLTLVSQLIV